MNADELIAAYAAGDLSGPERVDLERVLAASPQLRRELSRYQQLFLLLAAAAAEDLEVPASLEIRIARQLAVRAYLSLAFDLAPGLLGAYGRALIFYLRLA